MNLAFHSPLVHYELQQKKYAINVSKCITEMPIDLIECSGPATCRPPTGSMYRGE